MNPASAPWWLQIGPVGLGLTAVAGVAAWWIRKEVANEPLGRYEDPLPPRDQTPEQGLYVAPTSVPLDVVEASVVWARRWEGRYGEPLSAEGVAVLVGHSILSSKGKDGVVGNNYIRKTAGRFDTHRWTVVRRAEWGGPRPVFRWVAIRAYLSLDAGALDWLATLPLPAVAAVRTGNPEAYVRALVAARFMDPQAANEYAPEMVAAWRRLLA